MYPPHCHDLFYIAVKYHDNIPKSIQVTEQTQICIKKHQRGDNSKSIIARALIFVRDTVKYHQIFLKVFKLQRGHENVYEWMYVRTDARLIAISPEPFGRGIKKNHFSFIVSDIIMVTRLSIRPVISLMCCCYFLPCIGTHFLELNIYAEMGNES